MILSAGSSILQGSLKYFGAVFNDAFQLGTSGGAVVASIEGINGQAMVLNIGHLRMGDDEYVIKDIAAVVEAAKGRPVKVILECCLLTDDQIVSGCKDSVAAGAAFVKTSTGFSKGGATVEDVKLMRKTVGDSCKIKAAGGIHTREDAMAMINAGADRIGASSGIAIVSVG